MNNLIKIPTHMKAAVLWECGKPLSIESDIEIPKLMSGQVLVKMAYSGVCRSQLMEVSGQRGEDKYLPHLLGHEGCGKVVSVASDVTKVSEGDWAILGWIKGAGLNAPGAKYNLGDKIINSGAVTTFSTYTIVSENRIVPLPNGLSKDIAVLFGCALPTGAGIVLNQIKPLKNSSIAFIGLGGIGLSGLMATRAFECENIIAVDISDEKLTLAKEFGATHTINASNSDVLEEINSITNGVGVDSSVEAAGKVETIELAFKSVKNNGGQCIFASHPQTGKKISIDPFDLILGKNIKGSWGGASNPDKDIPLLANLYDKGMMPLEKLVTKKYRLDEINLALDDLKHSNVFRPLIVIDEALN
jgi:S-(hydroxymethyl)glutathione dehydrogenase / alcohol dehydrogenase